MEASPAGELQRLAELSRKAVSTFGPDGRLVWRIWGRGEALVLLHGGYGSWRHWTRNIDALSRHYELWVPDLPSLGASSEAPAEAGPEAIAEFVLHGMRELGTPALRAVAGFSFGSIIAGHMTALASVPSLVLIGPSGLGVPRAAISLEKLPVHAGPEDIAAVHRRNLAVLMISDPHKVDDLAVAIQSANVGEARFKSVRFSRADTLITALRRSQASRISAIWGANDAVAYGALEERITLLQELPHFVGYDLIKGAGHWVAYEAPEQFDAALLRQVSP